MKNQTWQIGDVKITQIIETVDGKDIQEGIPNATKENILKISWLKLDFADNEGNLKAQTCTFILETNGLSLVVDTGVGNNKLRNHFPDWNNLETNFLEKIEQAGFLRNKINFVFNTHLHFDHVG